MTVQNSENIFLVKLLALQQDGKEAISAPSNWSNHEPLLEVQTKIDEIINELSDTILLKNKDNNVARWHFFIGSPGNGKSAAIGKLCKALIKKNCKIIDEADCPIQELPPNTVPYALDVYENGNKYATARIVQDASVVRNPFLPDVDPAGELALTLKEGWAKGISLIICTNRGILEKAFRDCHTNPEVNIQPWFKILREIVESNLEIMEALRTERDFENKKTFSKVKITYSHLDNRSLLFDDDILDNLIQKAIAPENWNACDNCNNKALCPFKSNCNWLANLDSRKKFLSILRRAEIYSGQIIVFREALALISFVLAGCPRDYKNVAPCSWVQQRITAGDIFSLVSRRIYMSLFASSSPLGLEANPVLRKKQVESLRTLGDMMSAEESALKAVLIHVTDGRSPSIDVGINRLLGADGILSQIDPCLETLPATFYDNWDGDYRTILQGSVSSNITVIERRCIEVWTSLEQVVESNPDHTVLESHWALRRWSSNFLLHLGALIEGRTAYANELDQFLELLKIIAKDPQNSSIEENSKRRELDRHLEMLLDKVNNVHKAEGLVQLSDNVKLSGRWVQEKLKPKTTKNKQSSSLSLSINFIGGEQATLSAFTFLWLTLLAKRKIDVRCFPQKMLTGTMDARVRAATKGKYAFEDNDVELIAETGEGETFRIERLYGDVRVTNA